MKRETKRDRERRERLWALMLLAVFVVSMACVILLAKGASAQGYPEQDARPQPPVPVLRLTINANCAESQSVENYLRTAWHESLTHRAVVVNGAGMFLYQNLQAGSWTLVVDQGDGLLCILAAGYGWGEIGAVPLPEGEGS